MRFFWTILLLFSGLRLWAGEVMPPQPDAYFNDYAHVVDAATASQLNETLQDFERQSSDQIVVAIYPKMESDSDIADYTVQVARSWQVGQKNKNNGAVLFVFVQDHKMFIQVGYGLEGVLPDALCKRIIDEQISPRFKAGDFTGGLTAGVQSIIAATKGEYKGNGSTVADRQDNSSKQIGGLVGFFVFILFIYLIVRSRISPLGALLLTGGGWSSGRSSGGGFGGGGFSGGGGSFGGGGAGGSW